MNASLFSIPVHLNRYSPRGVIYRTDAGIYVNWLDEHIVFPGLVDQWMSETPAAGARRIVERVLREHAARRHLTTNTEEQR